jgi:hypothetical protein
MQRCFRITFLTCCSELDFATLSSVWLSRSPGTANTIYRKHTYASTKTPAVSKLPKLFPRDPDSTQNRSKVGSLCKPKKIVSKRTRGGNPPPDPGLPPPDPARVAWHGNIPRSRMSPGRLLPRVLQKLWIPPSGLSGKKKTRPSDSVCTTVGSPLCMDSGPQDPIHFGTPKLKTKQHFESCA